MGWLIIFVLLPFVTFSQRSTFDLPNYHPVSPNAANLGKFGLYPVNKNLGIANVSIPIYTISENNLNVPINLSYNMSGIRLNELASWVGLGWSLSAGGAIVRNTKGLPDLKYDDSIPNMENFAFNQANYGYMLSASNGQSDTAPDQYVFNALGISGSFYFDQNGDFKAVFEDSSPIKIEVVAVDEIHAVLEDGTKLIFGKGKDGSAATEVTDANQRNPFYTPNFISAWYLTELVSKDQQDTISFRYKTFTDPGGNDMINEYSIPANESIVLDANIPPGDATEHLSTGFYRLSKIKKMYLDKIMFSNGYVQFESSLTREDLVDDFKLDSIKVYNYDHVGNENLIEKFHFVYDYFLRAGGNFSEDYENSPVFFDADRQVRSREKSLKLNRMYRGSSPENGQKHTFIYNETTLPLRCTTAQDSWGFCNGNTGTLLPQTFTTAEGVTAVQYAVGNGNRETNESKMKAGVLEKIIYPTGGYTVFEHEANRVMVTEPTMQPKSFTAQAFGNGCPDRPHYADTTFVIPSTATDIKLYVNMSAVDYQGSSQSYVSIGDKVFYRPPNGSAGNPDSSDGLTELIDLYFGYELGTITSPITFEPGEYTIKAFDSGYGSVGAMECTFLSITINWNEPSGPGIPVEKLVGGLRIKSISNYDGKSPKAVSVKKFEYADPNLIHPLRNRGYIRKYITFDSNIELKTRVSSSPHFNNNLGGEPAIEYGKVTEYDYDSLAMRDNGKIVSYYEKVPSARITSSVIPATPYVHPEFDFDNFPLENWPNGVTRSILIKALYGVEELSFYKTTSWLRGKLSREETYQRKDEGDVLVKLVKNDYETIKSVKLYNNYIYAPYEVPHESYRVQEDPYYYLADFSSLQFAYQIGETQTGRRVLKKTTTTTYDLEGQKPFTEVIDYFYDNPTHLQLSRTHTVNSGGRRIISKTIYPDDVDGPQGLNGGNLTQQEYDAIELLKKTKNDNNPGQHRIAEPVQTEVYVDYNGNVRPDDFELISINRTIFKDWNNGMVLPEKVALLYGPESPDNQLDDRITYHLYDEAGNPREISKTDDYHTVYLWGYNRTLPIAKIENSTYNKVETALGAANLALLQGSGLSDQQIRDKIQQLRDHPSMSEAQITSFTHKPMVGLTSQVDPNGLITSYDYDEFNRLKLIRDHEDNIVQHYEYHYHDEGQGGGQ